MPLILPGNVGSAVAGAYEVANSCRFNDGDNPKMFKAQSSGNQDKWTFSCWFKRGVLAEQYIFRAQIDSNNYFHIRLESDHQIYCSGVLSGSNNIIVEPSGVLRDVSAWYHIVLAVDTGQAVAANRVKWWINGTQVTSFSRDTYPDQNADTAVNGSGYITIGNYLYNSDLIPFDGHMAEVCLIDNAQLDADSFGEFDSDSPTIWKPIDVSGLTFGTNGFYLDFEDSSNLGNDANGGTDLTESGLAATDSSTDSPTNNFCTLNPLAKGSTITLSEGNTDLTNTATWNSVLGTIGMASGKWYWEVNASDVGNTVNFGVCMSQYDGMTHAQVDVTRIMYSSTGTVYNANGSDTDTGTTYTDDDIIGIALNVDDGNIKFYKNNVLVHTETDSDISSNEWVSAQGIYDSGGKMNFGNPSYANTSDAADANGYGAFEFAPPSGYYALCTKNLAEFGG